MRVKIFAVVPALMVLVSLCGSPVPPPPGTVTGAVFFDANRNSIHDSCDSPMVNTQVVVNGPDGKTASTRTDNTGAFEIDDAPVGDGIVTLFTGEGLVWPITTTSQTVQVESSKEVGGVEIGSASKAVYDATKTSISGVIFDDANANGEVDRDECPIADAIARLQVRSGDRIAVIGTGGTYELKNLPDGHEAEVTAAYSWTGDPVAMAIGRRPIAMATNGVSGDEPCTSLHKPKPRYGPLVYEANIGFTLAVGNGTVAGVVFEDSDGDGLQDDSEAGVVGLWVRLYASGDCAIYDQEKAAATDANGEFTIGSLYPGSYIPHVDINPIGEYSADFVTMSGRPVPVTITDGGRATLNLPVKVGPAGAIRVLVFDDDDSDGVRGAGEAVASGIEVCAYLEQSASDRYYSYGYGNCSATQGDGVATIELLPEGAYSVSISGPAGGLVMFPEPITVRVASGEETDLVFPVALVSPEEQVIPPGTGETVSLDVCYSDPAWVRPDFDLGWRDEAIRQQLGYDEATARKIYGHGIYNSAYGEMFVWSTIAGFSFEQTRIQCPKPTGSVYFLVGYEPLDVVRSANVTQVRVRRSDTGLIAVILPEAYISDAVLVHLIVDENYLPIVRCSPYNGCEWNDGTAAPYYGSGY